MAFSRSQPCLFPKLLMHIPVTSLSAILIIVGFKLTKPALFASQWKLGANQFYPFVITILAIVFTDLLVGIGIGLIAGIFFVLRAQNKQSFELQKNPRSDEEEGLEITMLARQARFLPEQGGTAGDLGICSGQQQDHH